MIDELLAFIAPHHCYVCGKTGQLLCHNCRKYINYQKITVDFKTNKQAVFLSKDCQLFKTIIYKYKRYSRRATALLLAELINNCLPSNQVINIVPVPTIIKNRRKRGFDHMALIGRQIVKMNKKCRYCPVLKTSSNLSQKDLNFKERQRNVQNSIKCLTALDSKANYLIIDDITTTGATLKQSKIALQKSGAKRVVCLALIHA